MMVFVLALLLFLPCTLGDSQGHNRDLSNEYSFNAILHQTGTEYYTLYWSFDLQAESISFAVNVSTMGWVGLGISPNGGMPDSDVVIGWVKNGQVFMQVSLE